MRYYNVHHDLWNLYNKSILPESNGKFAPENTPKKSPIFRKFIHLNQPSIFQGGEFVSYMGVSKNRGKTPKMDGENKSPFQLIRWGCAPHFVV